jgi:hypothetical protein
MFNETWISYKSLKNAQISNLVKIRPVGAKTFHADIGSRFHYRGCTIPHRHTTFDRTPLDQWSARRRNLYLTTHNTHKRQTFMTSAGFEPTITANERPQTHASDRAATGICYHPNCFCIIHSWFSHVVSPNNGISQLQDIHEQNKAPREMHTVMLFGLSSNVVAEGTKRPHGH